MPPATRWTWKARTSSRSSVSGERPKKRANFATAWTYERCVAGDRLRTVISSIMRRRRGLISVIGGLPSRGWGEAPPTLADRRQHARRYPDGHRPSQRFSSIVYFACRNEFRRVLQARLTAPSIHPSPGVGHRPASAGE